MILQRHTIILSMLAFCVLTISCVCGKDGSFDPDTCRIDLGVTQLEFDPSLIDSTSTITLRYQIDNFTNTNPDFCLPQEDVEILFTLAFSDTLSNSFDDYQIYDQSFVTREYIDIEVSAFLSLGSNLPSGYHAARISIDHINDLNEDNNVRAVGVRVP